MDLIRQIRAKRPLNTAEMTARIKQEAPTLSDLTSEQLEQLAKLVITQRLSSELNTKINLVGINWETERTTFLDHIGSEKSKHTKIAYATALNRLEAYTSRIQANPLSLTPAQADDFIYSLLQSGAAAASIRLYTAACSSFYAFLERRHESIKNPFRGTKARPKKKDTRKSEIPTAQEVKTILEALSKSDKAAVCVMAYRGLRAGALPGLCLRGGRFTTHTKGKDISGELPQKAIETIEAAALDPKKPFAGYTANAIVCRIKYHIKKLHEAGRISAAYSCHDFRHFYAITEYRKTKDIHRVSKQLDHAGIAITETYLKGLGEVD